MARLGQVIKKVRHHGCIPLKLSKSFRDSFCMELLRVTKTLSTLGIDFKKCDLTFVLVWIFFMNMEANEVKKHSPGGVL